MKNIDVKKLHDEAPVSLLKKAHVLKNEIASLTLSAKNNPPKDTNTISKKKYELAVLLTLATQKKGKS